MNRQKQILKQFGLYIFNSLIYMRFFIRNWQRHFAVRYTQNKMLHYNLTRFFPGHWRRLHTQRFLDIFIENHNNCYQFLFNPFNNRRICCQTKSQPGCTPSKSHKSPKATLSVKYYDLNTQRDSSWRSLLDTERWWLLSCLKRAGPWKDATWFLSLFGQNTFTSQDCTYDALHVRVSCICVWIAHGLWQF
jgi:hypothetical protein